MSPISENDPEFYDAIPKPTKRRGFRLFELLVVVGIIVIVIAILLPARRISRYAATRSQCVNKLRQIGLALHNYEQAHGALPPAYTVDAQGRPLHSWRTLILPYLDQEPLYRTIDLSKPWNDPANAEAAETSISVFHCPEAGGSENTTTYLAIVAPDGCFIPMESRRLAEITDSHRLTLMVIEAGEENAVPWMAPVDADEALVMRLEPTSKLHHNGVTNVCFVDGRVIFLQASIPAKLRRALISIAGNDDEVIKELE